MSQKEYYSMLGLAATEEIDRLLEHLVRENRSELIRAYKVFMRGGKDPRELLLQILERIQHYIYFFLLQVPANYREIPSFVNQFGVNCWMRTYKHLLQVIDEMGNSLFPELHGEIGLITPPSDGVQNSESDPRLNVVFRKLSKN